MNTCKYCETTENIVYSATDALVLGHLQNVENVCYSCASTVATTSNATQMLGEQFTHRIQRHALGQFLSQWDESLSYEKVIEILEASYGEVMDDRILVWLPFAEYDGESIATHVKDVELLLLKVATDAFEAGRQSVSGAVL